MLPEWSKYLLHCNSIVFVIDSQDLGMVSEAYKQYKLLGETNVLIAFNKCDVVNKYLEKALRGLFGVSKKEQNHVFVSSYMLLGIDKIVEWMSQQSANILASVNSIKATKKSRKCCH